MHFYSRGWGLSPAPYFKGMMFRELYEKARKVDIDRLKVDAVKDNKDFIVDTNREQMRHGFDAKGESLSDYKSVSYAMMKAKLSSYRAPFMVPDLYLTGSFQKNMKMDVSARAFNITSTDGKTTRLKGLYGDIFGLAPASREMVWEKTGESFGRRLKKLLGL